MKKENKNPKISIVMGIYNCDKYLEESIESILSQTYSNWELIMCDDGSIDNTLSIAKKYEKMYPEKIKVLKNEKNMGLNFTLNKCIEHATGEYIARQDGDDVSLPDRLKQEIDFLIKNKKYSLVSANMIFFDETGDWGRSYNHGEVKKENFIKGSPICHAPCMIRKKDLLAVGGYSVDEKLLRVEDYHLWFKLFISGFKCYNLEDCLYKMRDDNDAYKRRNFKNRLNETRLKLWGFRKIRIPFVKFLWAFKPIIAYLLPKSIYYKFHQKNLKFEKQNEKIKIAQFVGTMNCGGTETMLVNLFKSFDKNKYEFVFIENTSEKCWYDDEILNNGGRIIKVQSFSFKRIRKYIKELITVFKKENFDVVHSHVYLHSGIIMYAAKKAGVKKRVSHSHSAMRKCDNNIFKTKLLNYLIIKNSTDLVACSTEAGIGLFGKEFLEKGLVLPNPIQLEKMRTINSADVVKLKKKYKIDDDTLVIGHVGRLVAVKNHDFLIEIATIFKNKDISFKMFFLGDGPLMDDIKYKVAENDLSNNIIITGNVSNVYEYMKIFDILLLPSIYEGLPVTLIEAQASGIFSIVSNNVSKESDLGLKLIEFCDIKNSNLWFEQILKHKSYKKISQEKIYKAIVEKKYDATASREEYEKLYN